MEKPFIYKYQPLWLNEFEIEEQLRLLITSLIEMDTLNILLIGESGSGKTSLINAIIREYYGKSNIYDNENILNINSLKEQGIAYYRTEVKTFCQTASNSLGKKKMLIIDDIDIINEQSQQVFRNYIDKYSHNVHFIISCINTQKVIDSIQSRMIIIKNKNLSNDKLMNIINKISNNEKIDITDDAKKFIISISNNSIRIIVNYFEKFKLLNRAITVDLISDMCTNISFKEFDNYTFCCKKEKDLIKAINIMNNIYRIGYSVMDILDNYFLYVKTTTLLDEEEKYKIIPYICKYITIFNNLHEDEIELALFTNNIINLF